jgi:hypothetical protein
MPHSREVDEDGILITTLSGTIPIKELVELQNELPSYACNDEIYELVLHPHDRETSQSSDEAIVLADNVRRVMKKFKKGAIAFVASRDYVFATLRQLQMRVENEYIQMAVFRTEETARKWLLEMKSGDARI